MWCVNKQARGETVTNKSNPFCSKNRTEISKGGRNARLFWALAPYGFPKAYTYLLPCKSLTYQYNRVYLKIHKAAMKRGLIWGTFSF